MNSIQELVIYIEELENILTTWKCHQMSNSCITEKDFCEPNRG